MIDPAQIVLFSVIIVLTILLVVLGIQVFFILRELRKTVDKANKVLEDTGVITKSVATPLSTLSSLAIGVRAAVFFANLLKKTFELVGEKIKEEADGELKTSAPLSEGDKKPTIRRFFRGISRKSSF